MSTEDPSRHSSTFEPHVERRVRLELVDLRVGVDGQKVWSRSGTRLLIAAAKTTR